MIPKIIHQLWIGPQTSPIIHMQTWKDKHPQFEYIFWNEIEIERRLLTFDCQSKIDNMSEYNGKSDIMRWEILHKYGGYFIDADSICIEPFDDYFDNQTAFATFENEIVRTELIATGTMGFVPNHPLCKDAIEFINSIEYDEMHKLVSAWGTVGPGLLTRLLKTGKYTDFAVYPSHCFLPIHFTGVSYNGHKKIYAHQLWGTANNNYDTMNSIVLPSLLNIPAVWVSILIPSYNTNKLYIQECLESIKCQEGEFGIELVWVNDGSSVDDSVVLEKELNLFLKRTRFCKLVYLKQNVRRGVSYSLHNGLKMCSNDIIFRMDSDDIMLPNRIHTQLNFMRNNPNCVLCGTNMQTFTNNDPTNIKLRTFGYSTNHPPIITWQAFMENKLDWLTNHPTICFYKNAVLSVGNYNILDPVEPMEDYELELKIMKKYGAIYNIQESLLFYRNHSGQITNQPDSMNPDIMANLSNKIIESVRWSEL